MTYHRLATPLFGGWLPHAGPGTAAALALAVLVVWHGPAVATRLPWRRLLATAYLAALGWTVSLALVDGWQRGFAGRLATQTEYLTDVDRFSLDGFVAHIVEGPGEWTTHVAGHPPGATLVFVALDRIGLGGGAWAAFGCVAAGALVAVAVPATLRTLGDEGAARAAVPFLVLFPGAVWIGVSADGLFAGVTASGIALLAAGLTRPDRRLATVGGLLLGFGCYLSYGLVLMLPLALATVVVARRRSALPWAVAGAIAVALAFTAGGFWWPDGLHALRIRYYQGIAADRPYAYWMWANLASLALAAGPMAAAVLRRAVAVGRRTAVVSLPLAAGLAIAVADLSGMSKAEVERIWLPFAVWLMAGAALLPSRTYRGWLAAQAFVALAVNHLVFTAW